MARWRRLTQRVNTLISKAELTVNGTDLLKEVAVFAERADISEEIQRIILGSGMATDIATQAQREGVRDLRQSGLLKVRAGMTTLEEVISVTNE